MVPIATGDKVLEANGLVVSSNSGDYADTDLILCATREMPTVDIAMYQAQFIRYGNLVYQFETPEALGAAISVIDPGSTHDAAQLWREEESRRAARQEGTLAPENPAPAPDAIVEEGAEKPTKQDEEPTIEDVPKEVEEDPIVEPEEVPLEVPEEPTPEVLPEPETPLIVPEVEPVEVIPAEVPAVDVSATTTE